MYRISAHCQYMLKLIHYPQFQQIEINLLDTRSTSCNLRINSFPQIFRAFLFKILIINNNLLLHFICIFARRSTIGTYAYHQWHFRSVFMQVFRFFQFLSSRMASKKTSTLNRMCLTIECSRLNAPCERCRSNIIVCSQLMHRYRC